MFSKVIVLLLVAASAIAGSIPAGVYRITNVGSQSTARAVTAGSPISVSSDRSNPGPFELWTVRDAEDGGYTLENVGLNMIMMLDRFAAVRQPVNGEPVVTNRRPTVFNIESAGNGAYVIKIQNDDLVWNVERPVVPMGDIALRPANGMEVQKWIFSKA